MWCVTNGQSSAFPSLATLRVPSALPSLTISTAFSARPTLQKSSCSPFVDVLHSTMLMAELPSPGLAPSLPSPAVVATPSPESHAAASAWLIYSALSPGAGFEAESPH